MVRSAYTTYSPAMLMSPVAAWGRAMVHQAMPAAVRERS